LELGFFENPGQTGFEFANNPSKLELMTRLVNLQQFQQDNVGLDVKLLTEV
jgi:hypothetical protein